MKGGSPFLVRRLSTSVTSGTLNLWVGKVSAVKFGRFDLLWQLRSLWAQKKCNELLRKKDEVFDNEAFSKEQAVVDQILPRLEEGGLLLKLRVQEHGLPKAASEGSDGADGSAVHCATSKEQLLCEAVQQCLKQSFGHTATVQVVRGEPFLNDLPLNRSARLRVDIEGQGSGLVTPTVDSVYKHLRQFGRLKDLQQVAGAGAASATKASFHATFENSGDASSALVCLHRGLLWQAPAGGGTQHLALWFDPVLHVNLVKQYFDKNSKFILVALLAVSAVIIYAVFEPIRVFFVETHLNKLDNRIVKATLDSAKGWIFSTGKLIGLHTETSAEEGQAASNTLKAWRDNKVLDEVEGLLNENTSCIVVLSGPPGSGKSDLVLHLMQNRSKGLFIRCPAYRPSASARMDAEGGDLFDLQILRCLIKDVGIFPSLLWVSSLQGHMEKVLQASIGLKASFASSAQTQAAEVLKVTAFALQGFAKMYLSGHRFFSRERTTHQLSEGASPGSEQAAEVAEKPVVVIEGYTSTFVAKAPWFASLLEEWAANVVQDGTAHIVIVTDTNTGTSTLSALKNTQSSLAATQLRLLRMEDAPKQQVVETIEQTCGVALDDATASRVHSVLGGRLHDVASLCHKVKQSKLSVCEALEQLIGERVEELRTRALALGATDESSLQWSRLQFFTLMERLVASPEAALAYDESLLNVFGGLEEKALRSIAANDYVVLSGQAGSTFIQPGSGLYMEAMKRIVSEKRTSYPLRIARAKADLATLQSQVDAWEKELQCLNQFNVPAYAVLGFLSMGLLGNGSADQRSTLIKDKLAAATASQVNIEREISEMKKWLASHPASGNET